MSPANDNQLMIREVGWTGGRMSDAGCPMLHVKQSLIRLRPKTLIAENIQITCKNLLAPKLQITFQEVSAPNKV